MVSGGRTRLGNRRGCLPEKIALECVFVVATRCEDIALLFSELYVSASLLGMQAIIRNR